ncbi:MAG: ectonucleotide pyrophosphatase/phosphodiesterase [Niabella sp.]
MKNILVLWLVAIGLQLQAQNTKRVILVSIDGLRPEFYLSDKWHTPNLHKLVQLGAHAEGVNSVFPSVTYPSHTTIVTGTTPDKHGIFFNNMFEPDTIQKKIYWHFNQVASPTVWEAANKAGLKTASLLWPASAEAPVGFNIPDIGGMGKEVMEKYSIPAGITDILKKEVFNGAQSLEMGNDVNVGKIAAWVIRNQQPDLMTIHMFGLDHAEHVAGREGKGVAEAIAAADSSIGLIWDAIKETGRAGSTLFIVTGDHGFYDIDKTLNPNVLLAKAGLLQDIDYGAWQARFHAVGGSSFLFVKNNDKKVIDKVKKILQDLPVQERKYFRIISEGDMKKIGADPNAVFALSGLEGAAFGNAFKGDFITSGKGGTHGHFPDTKNIQTGFIALGNTVTPGTNLDVMSLYDIAPIIFKYLGLKDNGNMKGHVPLGLFKK